jgi:hypothetical protein
MKWTSSQRFFDAGGMAETAPRPESAKGEL